MRYRLSAMLLTIFTFAATSAQAQETPAFPEPTEKHAWLKQFNGSWSVTSKVVGAPDTEYQGTIESEMLGEFWVINRMTSDMGGMKVRSLQTIGYDTRKKRYVGTWVDTALDHIWHYKGEVAEAKNKLIMVAEGPNFFTGEGMAAYRDSYEFRNADTILVTSEMKAEGGEWVLFMTGTAKRAPGRPGEAGK